jgi:hypothetical protein
VVKAARPLLRHEQPRLNGWNIRFALAPAQAVLLSRLELLAGAAEAAAASTVAALEDAEAGPFEGEDAGLVFGAV